MPDQLSTVRWAIWPTESEGAAVFLQSNPRKRRNPSLSLPYDDHVGSNNSVRKAYFEPFRDILSVS
eukprot:40765-Prymnesium_polylepis.1